MSHTRDIRERERDRSRASSVLTDQATTPQAVPFDFRGPSERPYRPLAASWAEQPVFPIFAEIAAAYPDKAAVDDGERWFTYRELHDMVVALAHRIAAIVPRGEPVGIVLLNGATYPVAMLAALTAGTPYVAIDPSFPESRNALIFRQSGMKALVVDAATRDAAVRMGPDLPLIDLSRNEAVESVLPCVSADDISYIAYTSGSTGVPKGVYYDQRALLYDALRRINCAHFSHEDRVAATFSPSVTAGQQDYYGALLTGATLHIVDLKRKGFQELVRVLQHGRITLVFCLPYVFRHAVQLTRDPKIFATVRHVSFAADRVFASDIELFRRYFPPTSHVSIGLGSSECNLSTHWFIGRDIPLDTPLMPVGYALPGYRIDILSGDRVPVAQGEPGEIAFSSRYLALGYWKDPELTQRTFSTAPDDPAVRMFRTGDLGVLRADGLLDLVGRADRQVKIRGNRVEPTEVEAVVRRHIDVNDAVIIPRIDGEDVDLMAYVVVKAGAAVTEAGLAQWLIPHLSDAMRPREIHFLAEIPMLGNFKHDVEKMKQMDRDFAARQKIGPDADPPPQNNAPDDADAAVREAVRTVWSELVGASSFDEDLSWDEAGGDLLKGLELAWGLEKLLGRPVPVTMLEPGTRPSEFIARLKPAQAAPLRQEGNPAAQRERPHVFFLPGLLGPEFSNARFAKSVAADYDVELLDYPSIDPTAIRPVTFDSMGLHMVRQIDANVEKGNPVYIVGYSLGAFAAQYAAVALAKAGHRIGFVGLIDTGPLKLGQTARFIQDDRPLRRRVWPERTTGKWWRRLTRALGALVAFQMRRHKYEQVGWSWRLANALGMRDAALYFRLVATWFARLEGTQDYVPSFYAGKVHVFKGTDPDWERLKAGDDLNWRQYCAEVATARVTGQHALIFEDPNFESVRAAVVAALDQATQTAGPETGRRLAS